MKISSRSRRQRNALAFVPASKRQGYIVDRMLRRNPNRIYAANLRPQDESQSLDGLSMKRSGKKTVITLHYKPV
jgi:hypothetical protein